MVIFRIMKLEGVVHFFGENLHQLKKIPARLDGIRKQDCYPPDDRQSGKPNHPV